MMDMSELIFSMDALAEDIADLLRQAEASPGFVRDRLGAAVRDDDPVRVAAWQLASEKYHNPPPLG